MRDFSVSIVSIDPPSEKFLRLSQLPPSEAKVEIRCGLPTSQNPPFLAPGLPDAAVRSPPLCQHLVRPQAHAFEFVELASLVKNRKQSVLVRTRPFCPEKGCRWLGTTSELVQRVSFEQT